MIWIYHKRVDDFDLMTDLSKAFRSLLKDKAYISRPEIFAREKSRMDGTVKYLFRLEDGKRAESVLMFDRNRITLCISTQVGCAMGCRFCQTGRIGLIRNLRASEIIDQLMEVERDVGKPRYITNVVLMGMGEPLANYDETLRAIKLMIAPEGLMFPARKITLSTCGLVPEMRRLAREKLKIGLAVSLNAADDETRSSLMPINRRYPIREVLSAAQEWNLNYGKPFTIEYVLIRGINDSLENALNLRRLVKGMHVKFNLIPFNPGETGNLLAPDMGSVERFRDALAEGRHVTSIRLSRGNDISGACGQLVGGYASP
jgi:23S rRNA (adenine2503-C2)-methyltransferase